MNVVKLVSLLVVFLMFTVAFSMVAENARAPPPTPLTPDLLCHYKFDEGFGTTTVDDTGNINDGTLYGAGWVVGVSGSALYFDGEDDYMLVDDTDLDPVRDVYSVEAWVKIGTYQKYDELLAVSSVTTTPQISQHWARFGHVGTMNGMGFDVYHNTGGHVAYTFQPIDTNWHYVVGVSDGTYIRMYYDGVETSVVGHASHLQDIRYIIAGVGVSGYFTECTIDELKIWTKALTADEIKKNYWEEEVDGIEDLPGDAFTNPNHAKTLKNKFNAVLHMLAAENYNGAIQKLTNDIIPKINAWVIDPVIKAQLLDLANELLNYAQSMMP